MEDLHMGFVSPSIFPFFFPIILFFLLSLTFDSDSPSFSMLNFCRCIPYRYKTDKESDGAPIEELEVLVVSSQKGKGMLFPKVVSNPYKSPNFVVSHLLSTNNWYVNFPSNAGRLGNWWINRRGCNKRDPRRSRCAWKCGGEHLKTQTSIEQ